MPAICGNDIGDLVELFNARGAKFYHACQLKDFKTYANLGGVPSRNVMEQSQLPYTPFDTDNSDRYHAIWNKVFGNLSDFGFSFAQGRLNPNTAPTPNPYGPILLIFNPKVFLEATDVAICLRSAGGRAFDRDNEALPSFESVNRIFAHEDVSSAPNAYAKAYIKYATDLQNTFGDPNASTPEVSCTVANEILGFQHLDRVIVDPYRIDGLELMRVVNNIKTDNRLPGALWPRRYNDGKLTIMQELAEILLNSSVSVEEIIENSSLPMELRDWAGRIQNGNVTFFFNRFAKYLRSGTLLELRNDARLTQPY